MPLHRPIIYSLVSSHAREMTTEYIFYDDDPPMNHRTPRLTHPLVIIWNDFFRYRFLQTHSFALFRKEGVENIVLDKSGLFRADIESCNVRATCNYSFFSSAMAFLLFGSCS